MFSYSLKPKKEHNNEYLNISNNSEEDNNILLIDLKTINFENVAVELALNVLQLNHNEYYNMNKNQIIQYYNNKMKLTKNMNNILALKIILKSKLKDLNGTMVLEHDKSESTKQNLNEKKVSETEEKINSLLNMTQQENYQIKQVQQNNFKIIQNNLPQNLNKNIIEYPNTQNINNQPNLKNQQNLKNQNQKPKIIYGGFNTTKIPTQQTLKTQKTQQALLMQPFQQSQPKLLVNPNNNYTSEQKINNATVITSTEFDIDSIINSYTQKKNQGFIK